MRACGMKFAVFSLFISCLSAISGTAVSQESEPATRQFAVAVGFQNQKLYDAAIDEWQLFLKKYPDDTRAIKALHYLGTCQLQARLYPQAAATLGQVVQKAPKFELMEQTLLSLGSARFALAQESKKTADYESAGQIFLRLSRDFAKGDFAGRALYFRGECLYQTSELESAAKCYADLLKLFPEDDLAPDAMYALGICQEGLHQAEKAQATFASFESRYPSNPLVTEVRMRQAEILFAAADFTKAESIFAAVSRESTFALADTAMLRQARCLYEMQKFEEAASVYWNVPRQFPNTKHYDAAVLAGAKCHYLAGKYSQARNGLEKIAMREVPEAAEASEWIARSWLKEKNPEKALDVLKDALRRHRDHPQLMLTRIDVLYEIPERRSDAAEQYAEFAKKFPQNDQASQALYMAALSSLEGGKHSAARGHAESFLQQFPKDKLVPDVQFIAAEATLLLKDYAGAEELYRRFTERSPEHTNAAQARMRRGLALHLAGRNADAVQILSSVIPTLRDPAILSEALAIQGRCLSAEGKQAPAAEALEKSLSTSPDRPQSDQTLLLLADVYRQMDRAAEAEKVLLQLCEKFPRSEAAEEATFRLGEAAYAQEQFAKAADYYQAVQNRWPKGSFAAHSLYGLGWTQFRQNEFQKSAATLTTLAHSFPKSELAAKSLYVRAMANYRSNEYDASIKDAEAFLKSRPSKTETSDARYLLGLSLAGARRFSEAAAMYAELLKSDRNYADADKVFYELGWAYSEQGKTDESRKAFQDLAQRFPASPLAAESLFRVAEDLYEHEQYDQAAKLYSDSDAFRSDQELAEKAAHKLGWCCLKTGKNLEAAEAFSSQLRQYREGALSGDAVFLLGESLFRQKNWEKALEQYQRVLEIKHPVYRALATFRSGECSASLERWADSQRYHQKVLDDFPEFDLRPEARCGVAWALQQQGRTGEAVVQYEKVTEETDTETAAKARFLIGECCFAEKKHADAAKHFLKAAFAYGHKEWSALAWYEAGRCFEVQRDLNQAKNCYRELIEKYPEHARVADAKKRLSELNSPSGSRSEPKTELTN